MEAAPAAPAKMLALAGKDAQRASLKVQSQVCGLRRLATAAVVVVPAVVSKEGLAGQVVTETRRLRKHPPPAGNRHKLLLRHPLCPALLVLKLCCPAALVRDPPYSQGLTHRQGRRLMWQQVP